MFERVSRARASLRRNGVRHCLWIALIRLIYQPFIQKVYQPLHRSTYHYVIHPIGRTRSRLWWFSNRMRARCHVPLADIGSRLGWFSSRCLAYLLWAAGVRILPVMTQCFGHIAIEIDCFLKEGMLGKRRRLWAIILVPPGTAVANRCLLDYWRKYVWVIESPWLVRRLQYIATYPMVVHPTFPYAIAVNSTSVSPALAVEWGTRPPLVRLTRQHKEQGRERLRQLGIPEGAPIVCFHCREPGYRPGESSSDLRDADILSYLPAVAALVERGFWCIRLGDPSMRALPSMPGVIDYARHELRGPWMDLYLIASCQFILGSASGPCQIAAIMGVPAAVANQIPLSVVLSFGPRDISIPKLIRRRSDGQLLTFAELLGSPLGDARFTHQYADAGVEFLSSSAEDIRELALEMVQQTEGTVRYSEDDERAQTRVRQLHRPGHYCYGSGGRVGRDFLRKYRSLVLPELGCERGGAEAQRISA